MRILYSSSDHVRLQNTVLFQSIVIIKTKSLPKDPPLLLGPKIGTF